jgi:hypothetical protein
LIGVVKPSRDVPILATFEDELLQQDVVVRVIERECLTVVERVEGFEQLEMVRQIGREDN